MPRDRDADDELYLDSDEPRDEPTEEREQRWDDFWGSEPWQAVEAYARREIVRLQGELETANPLTPAGQFDTIQNQGVLRFLRTMLTKEFHVDVETVGEGAGLGDSERQESYAQRR